MQPSLLTAALLGLTVVLTGNTPAHAQFLPVASTTTTTTTEPPNPFPLAPVATTTPPETAPKEDASTTVEKPDTTFATTTPTPTSKTPKKKIISAPIIKNKISPISTTTANSATTTATTTPFIPPILATQPSIGDVYSFTKHAPLSAENTQALLGLAALCALAGFLLAQKRFLENTSYTIAHLFSSRSLPQPRAERQ